MKMNDALNYGLLIKMGIKTECKTASNDFFISCKNTGSENHANSESRWSSESKSHNLRRQPIRTGSALSESLSSITRVQSYLREVSIPGRFGPRAYPAYETGSQVHKQGKTHDDISDFENQLLQVPQNTEASGKRGNRWKDSANNAFLER